MIVHRTTRYNVICHVMYGTRSPRDGEKTWADRQKLERRRIGCSALSITVGQEQVGAGEQRYNKAL